MLLHPHHLIAKSRCGFALISVLALVSLAALTATAFLASARLERQATLPMGNIVRLEWALASAEKCAEQTIGDGFEPTGPKNFVATLWRGTNTDDWTNEVGYLLIGKPNATNSVKWTYYAGFSPSGMTNLSTNVIGPATTFSNTHQGTFLQDCGGYFSSQGTNGFAAKPLATNPICTTIDLLGGQTSPPVGWVYITQRKRPLGSSNEVTSPVARVAWFIEDLSGKIDAENMGALSGNRSTGTNPEEICLTSMTRTNGTPIFSGTTNLMTNATNRKLFFTPGLLANQAISGLTNSDDLRYFATGLREFRPINKAGMNGMLDWIPGGIPVAIAGTSTNPYANSGSSKLNLNQLIALTYPSNVQSIASVISNNLPSFASIRAGGFTNSSGGGATNTNAYSRGAYYLTLAANIVDYADTDSTPTTDGTALSTNRIRPVYRGVDSYPFVNEIVKRYLLTSTSPMTISGINGLGYRVETTDYFELWNLSSQSTQPGTLTFLAVHGQPATLGFSNISFDKPLWASNSSGPISNGITSNSLTVPAIPPNGFTTLACTTTTNLFFYGSVTNPPVFSIEQELTNSRYFVAWNGVYYDAALRGIKRNNGSLPLGTPRNRGNLPSFTYGTSSGIFTNPAVGDPRATIYLSQVLDNNQYIGNATFGGRNVRAEGSIATTKEYYEVTPNRWPDGGHNSPKGSSPTSDNQIPTSFAPINTNLPPGRISNTGSLSNICELGGVFDPIQWADPSLGGWEGKWTNLSISASNNNTFGGGTSLRIGRAEHGKFAFTNFAGNSTPSIPNMGGSAAALLDLFCVTNGNTGGGPFRTGGKINLNTAPAPVLRALAGGILLTNDPSQSPKNAAVPAGMAEAFAQGVMRFRSKYPFLTPSHLSFIGTDPAWPNTNNWPNNSVFGNTNTISLSTAPGNTFGTSASVNISEWNDQAAGEWFSKIYNLSTVQSDNYRVYIVAQLVDTNKLPTSPLMRKYVQFAGRPDTPATGAVNATNIYGGDMWSWNLTKGLKKVYESPY